MESYQSNISQTIINTINIIFQNLFSSIDNNIFTIIDRLLFVNEDILNESKIHSLLGNSTTQSLLIVANSLLIGFSIYYCFKLLYSHLTYTELESPSQFIFRLLIFGICMNFSYFICEKILSINYLISDSICKIGENIFNNKISFSNFIINLNLDSNINSFDIFSLDGIIKSFISVSLFNLLFSFSLRYVLIKVFILITPFSFLTLINHSTSWFFKTWCRSFFGLLLLQSFVSIILIIIYSLNFNNSDLFSKVIYVGGIFALSKSNYLLKELVGGISLDISSNLSNLKNYFNLNH